MSSVADQLQFLRGDGDAPAAAAMSASGMTVGFLLRRLDCLDGIASHCETLIQNLNDNGVRVVMITGAIYCEPNMQMRLDNLRRLSVGWVQVEFPQNRLKLSISAFRQICAAVKEYQIDVLHLHGMNVLPLGKIVGWRTGAPIVISRHLSGYNRDAANPLGRRVLLSILQPLLRLTSPTRAIAICSDMRDWYVNAFRMNPRNVDLVYHGVDSRHFHPPNKSERRQSREEMRVHDDRFVCCSIGRVGFEKGHDVLIRAVAGLIDRGRRIRLIIAGAGTETEDMRKLAQSLGIEQHVHFTGFTLNVRQVLWASDAFVLASKREGFSLVSIEAMLCGVTPLRTPGFGASDQIVHEDNGFIFPFGDSEALATLLDKLVVDEELRRRMRRRALEKALRQFDSMTMTQGTMAVYALARRRPRKGLLA